VWKTAMGKGSKPKNGEAIDGRLPLKQVILKI
jgi:hypothetical protein